jgi:hypothetical protein
LTSALTTIFYVEINCHLTQVPFSNYIQPQMMSRGGGKDRCSPATSLPLLGTNFRESHCGDKERAASLGPGNVVLGRNSSTGDLRQVYLLSDFKK